MSVEKIYSPQHQLLGEIETRGDGNKVARDAQGKVVGAFNKNEGATRDAQGRKVADGDALAGLLLGGKP